MFNARRLFLCSALQTKSFQNTAKFLTSGDVIDKPVFESKSKIVHSLKRQNKELIKMSNDEGSLYPEIEPFFTGTLKVSDIHTLYYEQCGNKDGIPLVFLHGGPGSGTSPDNRRLFNPDKYHIILFHQRGAGKSTPAFCLEENHTWALVEDMEKLRKQVQVDRWVVFGGSWGSTLGLAYAETHIQKVLALVIRGIFTNRQLEQDWVYGKNGAALVFPEEYAKFVAPIPESERDDIPTAYHKRITGPDKEEQLKCATIWNEWELTLCSVVSDKKEIDEKCKDAQWNLAHAKIECHYFINNAFLEPNQLLDNAHIIAKSGIPVEIVQGRYDMVCPVVTAWDLHKRLPQSKLHIMPKGGHSLSEDGTGMTPKMMDICDKIADQLIRNKLTS